MTTIHKMIEVINGEPTPTGKQIWEFYPPIIIDKDETATIKYVDDQTVEVTRKSKIGIKS